MKFTQQTLITLALGFAAFQLTEALPSYTIDGASSYNWSKHYGNQDTHKYDPSHYGHHNGGHGAKYDKHNDYESMPSKYNNHHENDDDCDNDSNDGYGHDNDNSGEHDSWASYKPLVKRAGEDRVAGVINNIFPGGNQGILETDSRKNFPSVKTKKKAPAKSDDSAAADSAVGAKSPDGTENSSSLIKRSDDRPDETLDAVIALLNRITKSLAKTTEGKDTDVGITKSLTDLEEAEDSEPALKKRGMPYESNEMPEEYISQPTEDCEEETPDHHWEYYDGGDVDHEMPAYETPSEECEDGEDSEGDYSHWKKQEPAPMDAPYTKGWKKHGNYWQKIVRKVSNETGETTYYKIIKVIVPYNPHQEDKHMPHYPIEWNNEEEDCEKDNTNTYPHHEEGHSNKVYKKTSKVKQHYYEGESTEGYMQTTNGYGNISGGFGDEEPECEEKSSEYPSEY